jgi:predicted acetyltransferase
LVDLTPADAPRMRALDEQVWFEVLPGTSDEEAMAAFDYPRGQGVEALGSTAAAGSTPPLVGLYGAFDMRLTVPYTDGRTVQVPTSGLSWVGVHPDHRRRGVLRAMMRAHLQRVHEQNEEAVAALWAAEVGIYGRFGYGPASLEVTLSLSSHAELSAPAHVVEAAEGVTTHMMDAGDPATLSALQAVHESTAALTLGMAARQELTTREFFRDVPLARGTKERHQVLFALRDGETVGYATLRRTSKWDEYNNPSGEMVVSEMATSDSAALYALARRLVDFDLISSVRIHARSTDDALVWWSGGPRGTSMKVTDALWLRLVDLRAAMTQRGYAVPADVVLEVSDEMCEWNAGRWRLSVGEDGLARFERTERPAEVSLGVEVLGSSYLGGRSIASQAAAGMVLEHRPGAVRALSQAMRADTEPLGTTGF